MKDVKCDYSVEIYDNYSDEKFYYIVMEKCDEDLYDLLEKKANGLSESKIKDIFLELNVVFKKMNSKNIIHRDLKPENIFIKYNYQNNEDFVVKLGDFGLSREYHQKKFSTRMGTQYYRAPEIENTNEPNYEPTKCDLWSIGVIIYYIRFKDIPIYEFIQGKIPKKFDDENLNDLVKKLIVVEPSERINWEDYFNHPFFK